MVQAINDLPQSSSRSARGDKTWAVGGDQRVESAARLRSGTEGRSRVRKWCNGGRRRWRKAAAAAAPARARRRRRPVRVEGERERRGERLREREREEEGERILWPIYIQRHL